MPVASPPQLSAPDPVALYGRTDEPGAGPLQINQKAPISAGDVVTRNSSGEWVNAPGEGGLGVLGNLHQEGKPERSGRISWEGLPSFSAVKDEAAALITKEAILMPVEVTVGDVISKVGVLIGATAAGTPTHQWAALYGGTLTSSEATLIQQSADTETAAIAKEAPYAWTLSKAVTITSAMAPTGFVYAAVSVTATTVPSLLSQSIPAAANYSWITGGPFQGFGNKFSVSGTEGVAKSPTGTLTKVNTLPYVVLY